MSKLKFNQAFDADHGNSVELSHLLRRVTCNNPSVFTFAGTNSFIVGRGTVAIVDPGPDDDRHLSALLRAVRGETVSHVVITHSHMDHSPLAGKLKAATGAKTYGAHLIARATTGPRLDASIDLDFVPDVMVRDGDVIKGTGWNLKCVSTPGHLGNHMSFALESEKALLVGDHVMAWATTVVAPPDGHMGDYMASLRKLLKRSDDIYYPAHGPEARKPLSLVRGILAHRKMREEAVYERVKAGDSKVEQIVEKIYSDVNPALHGAAGLSTLAHLQHLVEQGRIIANDGVTEKFAQDYRIPL
jgi:glyoxylase-like metal-dependent hydrolase (beta-lactamase superfamily II)